MAAATEAAHVGLEVAVNVLVAYAGQVPLMLAPELAAAVVIVQLASAVAEAIVHAPLLKVMPVVPEEVAPIKPVMPAQP